MSKGWNKKKIKEVHRRGKHSEGSQRELEVKMRPQAAVEDVSTRTEKLARVAEYENI